MYWGKIIGTLAGLATLKPWFAVLGLFLGHQFDRGFAERYRSFEKQGADIGRVSEDFIRALFQTMGHLAKVDGRVSEEEIRAARMIMHRLGLSPAQVRRAIGWFDDGKRPGFPLLQTIREVRRVSARSPAQRTMFVRLLLEVVLAKDALKKDERSLIWKACTELDIGRVEFAQLEAMIRAQKGFKRSPAGDADAARVRGAYEALGISPDASNEEIKKAYRRLMNKSHPDKIAGSNPEAAVLAEAERRTREVRGAYEMLKARRSIR
ncbi:MAG: co-chaperone DjlA [Gammaproteobacteria bacterium]|nr:co-chaperone DjlA [Gammaproteobacteria bacterium]MBT8109441.1 co-chaperone DjlA [Gammaproteobacteria bacterium]NND47095.1 co-chaperone DjlA [Woeseiaceae bacterium]NNL44143.1 co-chaperone DjlA [Woeseiaceae bacterium]